MPRTEIDIAPTESKMSLYPNSSCPPTQGAWLLNMPVFDLFNCHVAIARLARTGLQKKEPPSRAFLLVSVDGCKVARF